jgi:hypothetical protein
VSGSKAAGAAFGWCGSDAAAAKRQKAVRSRRMATQEQRPFANLQSVDRQSPICNPSICNRQSAIGNKKGPPSFDSGPHDNNPGSDLLSHAVSHAVPSAVESLTSVFGMGTGVTSLL